VQVLEGPNHRSDGLDGAKPAPPFGRRSDAVTHGTP